MKHLLPTMLLLALPAVAQTTDGRTASGALVAPPGAAPRERVGNCTDVQVGSARGYDCVNARLGAVANAAPRQSSDWDAPVASNAPSNVVGTFNEAATRARLGPSFGRSAVPYRPAPANPAVLPPR